MTEKVNHIFKSLRRSTRKYRTKVLVPSVIGYSLMISFFLVPLLLTTGDNVLYKEKSVKAKEKSCLP